MQVSVFKSGSRQRDFRVIHPQPDKIATAIKGKLGKGVNDTELASLNDLMKSLSDPAGMIVQEATVMLGDRRVKVRLN